MRVAQLLLTSIEALALNFSCQCLLLLFWAGLHESKILAQCHQAGVTWREVGVAWPEVGVTWPEIEITWPEVELPGQK